ncbi:MAG: 5-formyltetrahydrofolate cyclo-ligase [Balneolaceae bacterium]
MSEIATRKKKLRRKFLKIRAGLSGEERERNSLLICRHLSHWNRYTKSKTVHCFMTIEKNGEVRTASILKQLSEDGKRIVLPRTDMKTKEMAHYLYESGGQLECNPQGIIEPAGGEPVLPAELDLVLVPVVAADLQKNRLGYGLGFYDRFLARTDALKAGLLFESCFSPDPLPVSRFDVKLDYLITEKGIY